MYLMLHIICSNSDFHDKPTPLCLYVTNYEGGVHEVTVSQRSEEKTANMIMAEIGYAVPVLGSALQMELLTDQAGEGHLGPRVRG